MQGDKRSSYGGQRIIYQIKKKAGENIETKRKEIGIAASEKEEGGSML